jgi:hypothetical protein
MIIKNPQMMETIQPITHILPEKDDINHPSHYTQGQIETIDFIIDKLNRDQFEGYVIGNVFKYCSRYKLKGGYQDLKKARWYLDKLIEMENN